MEGVGGRKTGRGGEERVGVGDGVSAGGECVLVRRIQGTLQYIKGGGVHQGALQIKILKQDSLPFSWDCVV